MPDPHHWTPDLLEQLVDTVPRLVKSRRALLDFFSGAGVPESVLAPHRALLARSRDAFKTFIVAREVLTAINDLGDPGLGPRREVLRRVTTFEAFAACWPDNREKAELGVRRVRELVERKDSFTEMRQEREREAEARRADARSKAEAQAARDRDLEAVRQSFAALFGMTEAQPRGRAFEAALTGLFKAHGLMVLEPFTIYSEHGVPTEQIDGVIEFDGLKWLVEAKWWMDGIDVPAVTQHCYRLFTRQSIGGLFISGTGYKASALEVAKQALGQRPVILVTLHDLWRIIDAKADIGPFLKERAHAARFKNNPFVGTPIPD
jgi:hypothetical protein